MKYTNGKKADVSAFPFKESPAKLKFGEQGYMAPGLGMINMPGSEKPATDTSHTHMQGHIVKKAIEEGEGSTSSDSLNTV